MTDRVTEYAREVVAGKHVVGRLHTLACKRHLDDLEKSKTAPYEYYWDAQKAAEIIEFAETLTVAEGDPRPLELLDCQAFDLGCTFGWLRKDNGKRRFRRRYKSMGRQNGKTMENGIQGTYIAGFSGYRYGKLFTVATTKEQAKLAWDEMRKFIQSDDDLSEYFTVRESYSEIICRATLSKMKALSKDAGLKDGARAIFVSIDEIHQHRNNQIYKTMYNGTRALPETLVSMITTRGFDLNSFCKEMDDYCVRILEGVVEADDFFVDIYCLDEKDDIWDSANYIKANPFLATTKQGLETLRSDAATARAMGGSELRDFITKALNMWYQSSDRQFVDAGKLEECLSDRRLEDMRGMSCTVGIDLSSGGDLTTYALDFEYVNEDGERITYLYSHSFMPRARMAEHVAMDLAPYDVWESEGLITVTGGSSSFKNDYKFIISDLKRLKEEYDLKFEGIGIDPHNADGILSDLEEFGCDVVTVVQSCRSLNDATEDIQLLVKSGCLEMDRSNKLLIWSFLNAEIVENSFKEKKIDKKDGKRTRRIDPDDACVNAHKLRMKQKKEEPVDVGKELDDYLERMGWL